MQYEAILCEAIPYEAISYIYIYPRTRTGDTNEHERSVHTTRINHRPATPQNHCSRERERNGSKHIVREAAVVVHVGGIERSLCTAAVALMWGQAAAAPVTLRCC